MPAHYERGSSNSVAFVFSCPGRHEKRNAKPAAGVTGANLEKLLQKIGNRLKREDIKRGVITIANSWDQVEFDQLTGRSEASDEEVCSELNIKRLALEIGFVGEFIVFCGAKARLASDVLDARRLLPNNPKFLFIDHLSIRGLNAIKQDLHGKIILSADKQLSAGRKDKKQSIQRENTDKRLDVLASRLVTQILKKCA